jgi:hypothetical protein
MATTIPSSCRVPHFVGNKEIKFEEKAVPEPGPGQLLLRVRATPFAAPNDRSFLMAHRLLQATKLRVPWSLLDQVRERRWGPPELYS